jgi:hypothetical protein
MGLRIVITPADLAWAADAVASAKERFPGFSPHGITTYQPGEITGEFGPVHLQEVVISRAWLSHFQHAEKLNRRHSSYGCKHFAEEWAGQYVCNGALIAAAEGLKIFQWAADSHGTANTVLALKYSSWPDGTRYRHFEPGVESVEVQG